MQLLFVIVKREHIVDKIIRTLAMAGIRGGTILEATGMAESLLQMQDLPVLGALKRMLSAEELTTSYVMLFALKKEELSKTAGLIKDAVGGVSAPNTGIMFAVPISYFEGIG